MFTFNSARKKLLRTIPLKERDILIISAIIALIGGVLFGTFGPYDIRQKTKKVITAKPTDKILDKGRIHNQEFRVYIRRDAYIDEKRLISPLGDCSDLIVVTLTHKIRKEVEGDIKTDLEKLDGVGSAEVGKNRIIIRKNCNPDDTPENTQWPWPVVWKEAKAVLEKKY